MRMQFRLPTTPPTPCTNGCSRSGSEQMRYMSVSFQAGTGTTLISVADSAFTQDSNGYVTLIVGTGAAIPSWITPANGYTVLDLSTNPNLSSLKSIMIRNLLPAATFNCSGAFVPFRTAEHTPAGGLMGEYAPVVDYPIATSLPPAATPLVQANTCGILPSAQPGVWPTCGLYPPPVIAIKTVTTQCAAQGCNQFAAQPQPPMIITGGGFGDFPGPLPYTGTSNYLKIANTTQNWEAGYSGDLCGISISEWDTNNIQLVANVNQSGACPLASGDKLTITVWNPQTMTSATRKLTVTN